MHHEIVPEIHDVLPDGYNSYSILLIPDRAWLRKVNSNYTCKLFSKIQKFCNTVCDNHLSSWLYVGMIGSFRRMVDLEVVSKIYVQTRSSEDVRDFICGFNNSLNSVRAQINGEYDTERANYFCKRYNLSLNKGPYLAFFNENPKLPLAVHETRSEYEFVSKEISRPTFILSFGGSDPDTIVSNLVELEKTTIDKKRKGQRLTLDQLNGLFEDWCRSEKEGEWETINNVTDRYQTIFISYANEDKEIILRFNNWLKKNGFSTWFDKEQILPGQDWELTIQNAIKNCSIFIACLSDKSISKRGYVQKELKTALDTLDRIPEGEIFLMPIRFTACQVPESLLRYQYVDYFSKEGRKKLMKVLKQYFLN